MNINHLFIETIARFGEVEFFHCHEWRTKPDEITFFLTSMDTTQCFYFLLGSNLEGLEDYITSYVYSYFEVFVS
jgi:hypothetical protein